MAGSTHERAIREAVEPIAQAHDLVVETVRVRPRGPQAAIEITLDLADGPGSLGSELLGEVSREISQAMDALDPLEVPYNLEIGTPGTSRPLETPRLFRRAQGRLVDFRLTVDGSRERLTARVVEADETAVTVSTGDTTRTIPYDTVDSAVVEVELRAREDD